MNSLRLPLEEPAYVFVVLFVVILVAPLLAERARLPGIIGLILAGMAIGPHAAGVLDRVGPVALLGGVGLLYLMFLSGLEMDLEGFAAHRRDSIVFGSATFVIPMAVNTGAALAFGYELPAALLIASAFTSHTLLAYPLVQRFGLLRNRAVTATIGATVLATVGALLVLAVVAAMHQGDLGPLTWVVLVLGLAAFSVFAVWGLPLATRWFFASLGQDRMARFLFVLVVLFAMSAFADAVGIEAIVGAFLAGLAMNRYVAEGSVLMERVQFLGSSLFIPLFLVSTGMLIDPAGLVRDPWALGLGLSLAAAALLSKWLAAWISAKPLGFGRPEAGLMFALTSGQAAGALAAVIVAVNIGLVGQETVNAVVFVILVSALLSPLLAARFAPFVPRPERRVAALGYRVVVPVANPHSAGPLVKLAALVAGPDQGAVIPVNILSHDASPQQVEEHREITTAAEQVALRNGADAAALVRIDASPTAGVLHTVVEEGGTLVLLGWKGYANRRENFFGGVIDAVLRRLTVPALVCRPGPDDFVGRLVLSVTSGDLAPAGWPGLELAVDVAGRMARQADVPLLVITESDGPRLGALLETARRHQVVVDARKPPVALREHTRPGDVVVLSTAPTRAGLALNAARVARALRERTVVVTVPRLDG